MRLLDTETLVLHEFWEPNIPKYAILSHRWEREEVTFQDMSRGKKRKRKVSSLTGYAKIRDFCIRARKDGLLYGWVDTCCIDKTSSAELSESIISMWNWYEKSQRCYAYLSDVPVGSASLFSASLSCIVENIVEDTVEGIPSFTLGEVTISETSLVSGKPLVLKDSVAQEVREEAFRNSAWFTRGWTLQELLAPRRVEFFDFGWESIGSKSHLVHEISKITKIDYWFLLGDPSLKLKHAPASTKFSWAANRVTTRVEDQAYSLMGLFKVYFPPLYGEGSNAFKRLQIEIMQESSDNSIFAWTNEGSGGLFATSPSDFRNTGDLKIGLSRPGSRINPFSITNIGLHIELPLLPLGKSTNLFYALLNCVRMNENRDVEVVALRLKVDHNNMAQRYPGLSMLKDSQIPKDIMEYSATKKYVYIERETYLDADVWELREQLERLRR